MVSYLISLFIFNLERMDILRMRENGNLSDEEKVVNYCRELKFVISLLCVRG